MTCNIGPNPTGFSNALLRKWIANRKSLDCLTIPQVLRVKRSSASLECRCNDERVEDCVAVSFSKLDRAFIGFDRQRYRFRSQHAKDTQSAANFFPTLVKLTP